MKPGAPDSSRSLGLNRGKEDSTELKNKWLEILEEEGVSEPIPLSRVPSNYKSMISLDEIPKKQSIKVVVDNVELPNELFFEGILDYAAVMRSIGSFISHYTSIAILRMVDCKLKAEAIQILGSYNSQSRSLKELYLDLNPINGQDYSPLLANLSLEVLSLKGCAISGEGAELISNKLSHPQLKLKILNLNTNLIDDQGAKALAKGIKWSTNLLCLSLAGNSIGVNGAHALILALQQFTLDEDDMERRNEALYERACQIKSIVNERKEWYLTIIPPMPPLPPAEFGKKPKVKTISKSKKRSDPKTSSKPRRVRTQSVDEKKSDLNGQKASDPSTTDRLSRNSFVRQSTSTAITESVGTATLKLDEIELSDDDSIPEIWRYETMLTEDWDRNDNERRYKEKMTIEYCRVVANELHAKREFNNPFLSRVHLNQDTGKIISRGNLNLSHLILSHNKITEEVIDAVMDMVSYQEKVCSLYGLRKGINVFQLDCSFETYWDILTIFTEYTFYYWGNLIPTERLSALEAYITHSTIV